MPEGVWRKSQGRSGMGGGAPGGRGEALGEGERPRDVEPPDAADLHRPEALLHPRDQRSSAHPDVDGPAPRQRVAEGLAAVPGLAAAQAGVERWPLYAFVSSAMLCLGCSAVYHLFGTANERWYYWLGNFDYAGITALIVGL